MEVGMKEGGARKKKGSFGKKVGGIKGHVAPLILQRRVFLKVKGFACSWCVRGLGLVHQGGGGSFSQN